MSLSEETNKMPNTALEPTDRTHSVLRFGLLVVGSFHGRWRSFWSLGDFRQVMKNIGLLLLLLILVGCSSPSKRSVQRAFLQEHPNYTVVGITKIVNRGDIPYADFTIGYTRPSDFASHAEVWHYYNLRDPSFVVKEIEK